MNDLRSAWNKAVGGGIKRDKKNRTFRGKVGKSNGDGTYTIDVPDQPGKIYVRVIRNDGMALATAFNAAPREPNEEVWLEEDLITELLTVKETLIIVDTDLPAPKTPVGKHHHDIGSPYGDDPVRLRRIVPGLVSAKPSTPTTVIVWPFYAKLGDTIINVPKTEIDMSSYRPSTAFTHWWVIIGLDSEGAIDTDTGSEVSVGTDLDETHMPTLSNVVTPLAAVRLRQGQTRALNENDFIDLRNITGLVSPFELEYLELPEIAAPSNPANTHSILYTVDEDGLTESFLLDSTGLRRGINENITIPFYNDTGDTLNALTVVRVIDAFSGRPTVERARADSMSAMSGIIGVVVASTADSSYGRVMAYGRLYNVNTSGLTETEAYVSSLLAGSLTSSAPALARRVGFVLTSHASTGILLVAPGEMPAAPPTASYIVKTADSGLTNEFALSTLTTGLIKVTTGTGNLTTAIASTDYVAPNTGSNVINTNMITNSAVTDAKIASVAPGKITGGTTVGDILKYNGSAFAVSRPSFGTLLSGSLGGDTSSISLTGLSTSYGNFTHLRLVAWIRTDRVNVADDVIMRFNSNNNSAVYYSITHTVTGAGQAVYEQQVSTFGGIRMAEASTAGSSPASFYAMVEIVILFYRLGGAKTGHWNAFVPANSSANTLILVSGGFQWFVGDAITSITLLPRFGTNFKAGSSYSLFGFGEG